MFFHPKSRKAGLNYFEAPCMSFLGKKRSFIGKSIMSLTARATF